MKRKRFSMRWLRSERGNILVLAAVSMMAVVGMAALAIDVSYVLTARNQLQAGVDASALAGAAGLMTSRSEATRRAMDFAGRNQCIRQPVAVSAGDVTFPGSSRVRVQSTRQLPLFFAPVLGMANLNITADATAELGSITGANHLKPFAVPDFGFDLGERVLIKSGEIGAPGTNPSFFYPSDYPPVNRGDPIPGATEYENNIVNGCSGMVRIGDVLQIEPGNMVGPTKQGVDELMGMDPHAHWDASSNSVVESGYDGFSSPRICIVPLYDPDLPPDSGRNTVTVTGLAVFFIEGMQGKDLYGRFMEMLTHGDWGSGNTYLYGIHLVE